MEFKVGDNFRVLVGVYVGKHGVVTAIAENAAKSIGTRIYGGEKVLMTTWFRPEEIEKV